MAKSDPPLEDVGVVARVVARRIGRRYTQQLAEVGDEELVIGQFGSVGILPAADEGIERKGCGAGDGMRAMCFGHAREYATETPATAPCPSCTRPATVTIDCPALQEQSPGFVLQPPTSVSTLCAVLGL